MKRSRYIGMLATLVALAAPVLPAQADPISVVTKPNIQTIAGNNWQNVSSTTININLATTRRVVARFTAESACSGGGNTNNSCSVRIVYQRLPNGAVTEFNPVVGTDFAFDSTDQGDELSVSWESHAVNRSATLPAGNYQIFVQARTSSNITSLSLDDAHFEVEQF